jgi:hypothetical protein
VEELDEDSDNGTMVANVDRVRDLVVGRKIVSAVKDADIEYKGTWGYLERGGFVITLDDGKKVVLADGGDCCAYTGLEGFLLNVENVDHVITGVGTTGEYTKWHIYADLGDVLTLDVVWSPGNAFYYGYGFEIAVIDLEENTNGETE